MRKPIITALAVAMLVGMLAMPATANNGNGKSSGCTGVAQAQTKANAKGQDALAEVADKLGCEEAEPDLAACATGSSLARFVYEGSLDGPEEHGYPTWEGTWTRTGDGVSIPHGDGGGFYWDEAEEGSVLSIVLVSFTGERVVLDAEDYRTPGGGHAGGVSQNVFEERTGINLVTFCG